MADKYAAPLPLRPHHGMCISFFEGKGYSNAFTAHMARIKHVLETEDPQIQLVNGTDSICAPCPNNLGALPVSAGENDSCRPVPDTGSACKTEEKVQRYDRAVLAACELNEDTVWSWSHFHGLVKERILDCGKRRTICGDCQWNEICR